MLRLFALLVFTASFLSTVLSDPLADLLHGASPEERDTDTFQVPYNLQQGPIRYAPMQSVPPTAITATNTSPLWPTSSVSLAKTYLPPAAVQTTVAQGNTNIVVSHANTAATQSQPVDDMERFLNRWKD